MAQKLNKFNYDMKDCSIRVYDKNFNWLTEIQQAESVQFTRELYGTGSFELHIHPDKKGVEHLVKKDNIIVINRDGRKVGIIRDFTLDESRNEHQFVIWGDTGDGITKRRITVPPTTAQELSSLGWDRISGNAETIIKHYASRNLATPFDANRKIDNLIVTPDLHRGKTFPWQTRYNYLDVELNNVCNYSEMGYNISADVNTKQFIFDVIDGVDRSQSQDVASPVVFRMEFQNIGSYRYAEDRQNYKNTGYAGGQGEDENRLIYILNAQNKGLDRIETFLDCGNAANITELMYYGTQRLNEFFEAKNIEVTALPQTFKYDEDYFLGDLVTVIISRLGLVIDTRITSIKEIWERATGHTVEARFGQRLPNVFTILDRTGVNR